MKFQRIKGTQDILPDRTPLWQHVENVIRKSMHSYNYHEIRTPVFERTEVFARGIGQLTDIVSKEMYTFLDKGKKSLTLKPEMTAPVIRAYLENNLANMAGLTKVYYISPLFRQENPQAGRLRQFNQFGAEAIGAHSAELDAEMIMLSLYIYRQLGLKELNLKINSVGDPASRRVYTKELKNYFKPLLNDYCPDCRNRFETNPLRILDCKNKTCQKMNRQAPKLLDYLSQVSQDHFQKVITLLNDAGLTYQLSPYLVRGLDYYTDTVFEITSDALGSQDAICGGGRYDLLADQFGGPSTPAVGFASGIERLLMVMQARDLIKIEPHTLDIYLCTMGQHASQQAMNWIQKFRDLGYRVDRDYLNRSIKAQMREANRQQARLVLILGDIELEKNQFSVKNMQDGSQTDLSYERIIPFLNQHFKR
jgi:histidyl-tRNA synthetase